MKMATHNRKKKTDTHRKNTPQKTSFSDKSNRNIVPIALAVAIGLLAGLIFVFALPGNYSGPKHHPTDKKIADQTVEKSKSNDGFSIEGDDNSSSCQASMEEAQHLLKMGRGQVDSEAALDMIASCVLKEPDNAAARWNLAAALLQLNRGDEAVVFIDEALTLAPDNKQYFSDAGKVFASMNRPKESIRCLERYLELSLHASSWPHLLAGISVQREDEWAFLYETDRNIIPTLELLLQQYLRDKDSLIKTGYLFKVVIGLKGPENDLDLVKTYAFFCFGLCDFANGMNNLHILTEHQYVAQGYGDKERAFAIVSTHALRLFMAGLDGFLTSIARNLLMNGKNVFDELLYNCDLSDELQQMKYSEIIRQADVKRILVSCIVGQNVIPVILENGAVVHAENIFGWTPLLQAVSLNSSELVFQILSAGADVQSRTPSSMTALHIAAVKGSTDIVLQLTQAGLNVNDRNVLNQTALDIACSQRWYAKQFAKSINVVNLPGNCPVPLKFVPPLKQGFKNGGWLTPSLKVPKELSSEVCDIDVLGYSTIAKDILLDYIILQRPVLIRNATNPSVYKKLYQLWQRNKIIKEYGNLMFNEISDPLSEFGIYKNQSSLKMFLEKMETLNEDQSVIGDINNIKSPPHILQIISKDSELLKHFDMPPVFDPSLTEIIPSKYQFHVGPAFSGVSPRFHMSSWNALVFGRRRWFLFPPKYAFYSNQHVWDWWQQSRTQSSDVVWECVQHPGDVMLLPDMWGYAVMNLKESIGLSSEFIHGSNEFSL